MPSKTLKRITKIEELPEFRKTLRKTKGGKISAKQLLKFAINPWFGIASLINDKRKEKKKKVTPAVPVKRPRENSSVLTDSELETIYNLLDSIVPESKNDAPPPLPPRNPSTVPLRTKTDGNFNLESDDDIPPPLPPRELIDAEPPALPPRETPTDALATQIQMQRERLRHVPKTSEEKIKEVNKEHPIIADMEDDDEWGDLETTQYDPYMEQILENIEERDKTSKGPRRQYLDQSPITSIRIDEDRIRSRRRAIAPEEMSDDETGWGIILKNLKKKRTRGRKTRR